MYKVQTGTTAQPQTSYLRKVLHPYGCSHYSHFSASYQQETYQISPFPSIDPYISNQKIQQLLCKHKYLLKYSKGLSNKEFKLTGMMSQIVGLRASTKMFAYLLKYYKRYRG